MNSNLDRYIPTQDERWESLDLASLVALLGGSVTREFEPATPPAPYRKTYVLIYNGVEIGTVTYTQDSCMYYTGKMFQNGEWLNAANFGTSWCIEPSLYYRS